LDTVGGKRLAQRRAGVSGLTLRTALPATAGWESTVIPSAAGGAIGGRNHLGGVTTSLGGGAGSLGEGSGLPSTAARRRASGGTPPLRRLGW